MALQDDAFVAVPVNRLLGFELRSRDAMSAVVAMQPQPAHAQEYGVVHGGILAALADTAAVYTILPVLPANERMTSIEFKVNFLGAGQPERGEILARATLVRKGRTVAVARVDVHQGETLLLTGLFTYIVLRMAPAEA